MTTIRAELVLTGEREIELGIDGGMKLVLCGDSGAISTPDMFHSHSPSVSHVDNIWIFPDD